jgi:predicted glycosyltransferase
MGLGHTRRHLAIAAALTELAPDASVMLASGADEVNRLGLPANVEVLKLPSLRKITNDQYASRRLRIPAQEIRALRSALLTATVKTFRPTAVLVDKHPFGAGGEFRDALDALRANGGAAALGLRDILDSRETVLGEWAPHKIQDNIAAYYDEVLIYGQRAVFDPIAEYGFLPEVAERTRFCGYIVNRPENSLPDDLRLHALLNENQERPLVLATAGGGEDGYELLENFMRAAARAHWRGIAIAGPMTPDPELRVLQRLAAEAGVALHTFVPNLSTWFWSVDALVCMGGYNTITEALCTGVPTVCVPRVSPRSEQLIRACALEKLGLLRALHPDTMTVESMRDAISLRLGESRQELIARASQALNFDGARQAASHLLALSGEKRERRVLKQSLAS